MKRFRFRLCIRCRRGARPRLSRPSPAVLAAVAAGLAVVGIPAVAAQAQMAQTAPSLPFFDGLGKHTRKITTSAAAAQRYFDQGMNFLFAFNHGLAIRSFEQAAAADPDCAMAYWGIAVANGPHINFPFVPPDHATAAVKALARARELADAGHASAVEKALIAAQTARFTDPQPEDRHPLDAAYADAMRGVRKQYPADPDVGVLFAESLMDLRPWDVWTRDGRPFPETSEIVSTLESVLKMAPNHPQALHLYIHAMEESPDPRRAIAAADRLRFLTPGLGHLVHMPSHIDILVGRWQQAIDANRRAVRVDHAATKRSARPPALYAFYIAHNWHVMTFAAMMSGQSALARDAARSMMAELSPEFRKENAPFVDFYLAMPYEAAMRFGKWNEILAEPEPPAAFPLCRALRLAARGVAQTALNRLPEARATQAAFETAAALVPKDAMGGLSPAAAELGIARAQLQGELWLKEGKRAAGLAALRDGVAREDALHYDEAPDWVVPLRHALGAALLTSGTARDAKEAEAVYRADLKRWPENGWSLYGLSRSLRMQGKTAEAGRVQKRFVTAWKHADIALTTSCFCQMARK